MQQFVALRANFPVLSVRVPCSPSGNGGGSRSPAFRRRDGRPRGGRVCCAFRRRSSCGPVAHALTILLKSARNDCGNFLAKACWPRYVFYPRKEVKYRAAANPASRTAADFRSLSAPRGGAASVCRRRRFPVRSALHVSRSARGKHRAIAALQPCRLVRGQSLSLVFAAMLGQGMPPDRALIWMPSTADRKHRGV